VNQVQRKDSNTSNYTTQQGSISWILDTGATDHVTYTKEHFIAFHKIKPICIKLPNSSTVTAHFAGTVQFSENFIIFNVLYIPEFTFNLISVQTLIKDLNCVLTFSSKMCQIQSSPTLKTIGHAEFVNGLYYLHSFSVSNKNSVCSSITLNCNNNNADLWHFRLGHPGNKVIKQICTNFPYVQSVNNSICDICHFAKLHKLPFPKSTTTSAAIFDLIHVDKWGPMSIMYVHGHKYFLSIVDDLSKHMWAYMMHSKGETRSLLRNFIIFAKNQYGKNIKIIRSDNGPEFCYTDLYNQYGIDHQRSCVETPQQNAIVERKHQHVLNVARSLMFQSNLPKVYWTYAVSHAIHLINRLPTPTLKNKSPYEIFHGDPPTLLHLKVFGCLCYASTLENNRTKFDPRARKGVFIGYKTGVKGYIVLDIQTREIFISRNVIFYEHVFPYVNSENKTENPIKEGERNFDNIFCDYIHNDCSTLLLKLFLI